MTIKEHGAEKKNKGGRPPESGKEKWTPEMDRTLEKRLTLPLAKLINQGGSYIGFLDGLFHKWGSEAEA